MNNNGNNIMVTIGWGVGVALLSLGALYVWTTMIQHVDFVLDTRTIIEVAGSFVAGLIGGHAWQNKHKES